MNKEIAIHKLELLIEDLKKNKEAEKQKGISYFNTDLFAIRVITSITIAETTTSKKLVSALA